MPRSSQVCRVPSDAVVAEGRLVPGHSFPSLVIADDLPEQCGFLVFTSRDQ
jgi:hypothetical protein